MTPQISIILPTYNEETNIRVCLDSLVRQDYPKENIEVLLPDGGSTDRTIEIAKEYQDHLALKIIKNERRDCHFGKVLGIQQASNDLLAFLDADNEIAKSDWLSKNIQALSIFQDKYTPIMIESNYLNAPNDTMLCNHLTTNLYIGDPLAYYLTKKPKLIDSAPVGNCTANIYRITAGWPTGANGFFVSKSLIEKNPSKNEWFAESDFFARLSKEQDLYILRVDGVGVYHHYVKGWSSYFKKRLKLGRKYFTRKKAGDRQSWVTDNGSFKLYLCVFYLSTFFLPLIESIYRMTATRDIKWLLHPIAGIMSVLAYCKAYIEIKFLGKEAF